ncbi:HAD-IA family hydrolase [Demequina sp. TMPB413]|nr:HAD-IA family hydrolase [Demequina sp. TMPB413]
MAAWRRMFTTFFASHGITPAYTDEDYFAYIDGRPRYEGVQVCLASRGVELPYGSPSDPPGDQTVCALGNSKNDAFNAVLDEEGVTAFPGSVALIDVLESLDVPMAVVSSSRNAAEVLRVAGLAHRFQVVVDGNVAAAEALPGKPKPDTFQYAATQLGVSDAVSVVVEDAISGVQAGAAGDFALVIGVDRGAGADGLVRAGADVVVRDLAELVQP